MKKNKILMIGSGIFFGNRVGGFRQDRWMKAFLNEHYVCTVLDVESFIPNEHTFETFMEYQTFRTYIKYNQPTPKSIKEGLSINILRKIKHFFILEVFNPINLFQLFFLCWKLRKEKFDFVFASSPPFSSAVIAFLYKIFSSKTKLIIDFRDEWGDSLFLPKNTIIDKKNIEGLIIRKSLLCITVSKYSEDNLKKLYNFDYIKCIYNAPDINYQLQSTKLAEYGTNKIKFLYTGSQAKGLFDYEKLFLILNNVDKKYTSLFKFSFIGSCGELQRLGTLQNSEYKEQVSLEVSRRLQQECDILLFLAANFPNNGGIVSSKIFEYIQSEKPILPLFVQEGSDVYHIIKEACGWCPCLNSTEEIMEMFEKINISVSNEVLPSLKNKGFLDELLNEYPKFVKQLNDV